MWYEPGKKVWVIESEEWIILFRILTSDILKYFI